MSRFIKIGTRNSELALWQSGLVQKKLSDLGFKSTLVEVSSQGDEILDKPLHQIGGMGLFTKALDMAMLRGDIDIAVHSLKDVPTDLPDTIVQAAVLERANAHDIIVYKGEWKRLESNKAVIATGSFRRKAQWLNKYPTHTVTGLRGNVNTRLKKLKENNWDGAIFAHAGLDRINLLPKQIQVLDWMVPAPAQGAIMITALKKNRLLLDTCSKLNDKRTEIAVAVEREFMKTLEGGCTAPIGAHANILDQQIHFKGVLSALDGKEQVAIDKSIPLEKFAGFGALCAHEVLDNGGFALLEQIKSEMRS